MQEWENRIPVDKLEQLLRLYGIASEFITFSGETACTSLEHRVNILLALGAMPADEADVDRVLSRAAAQPWQHWLAPFEFIFASVFQVSVCLAFDELEQPLVWKIRLEEGGSLGGCWEPAGSEEQEQRCIEGTVYSKRILRFPALPSGYHRLQLDNGQKQVSVQLVVAPGRCHEPEWLSAGKRIWGVSVQLYTMMSDTNLGHGDLADLRELIDGFAARGADFILINPLHALDNRHPEHASPYSPADRRFLNPLYIHPRTEPDFYLCPGLDQLLQERREEIKALGASTRVEYRTTFRLKYQVFDQMYQYFKREHLHKHTERARDFRGWAEALGTSGEEFADFQAQIAIDGIESAAEPAFHLYLQWLAERQLEVCQRLATELGMKLGIIRDLAVGSGKDSFEVLSRPELYCHEVRIGAPPDHFNPDGQNWNLLPLRPMALAQSGFARFIELLRVNMKFCGALRIDHVMSLMRLWWCPADGSNAAGAYVHYPVRELFAILRLESQRAGTMIIGEDLGVVPPEIRQYLDEAGVLSNIVFYFEKYGDGQFKRPEHYRHKALAFVANHDVPPLKAWWNGRDISLRRTLGLIRDDEHQQREEAWRLQEKQHIVALLQEQQLLPSAWHDREVTAAFDADLGQAILRLCARSASQLLSVQLDDIAGLETPVNIPGTSTEYANWRRKMPLPLPALLATEYAQALLAGLQERKA